MSLRTIGNSSQCVLLYNFIGIPGLFCLFVCFQFLTTSGGKIHKGNFFSFLMDITLFSICAQEASNSQFFIRKQMGAFGWSRSNIFPTAYLT